VVRIVGPGEMEVSGQVPFTPRAKKALESALREAVSLGHQYVGTEHLLLGLVREDEGAAIRILADLGQDRESVRAAVMRVMPAPSPRRAARSQLRVHCPTCSAPLEPPTADAPDAVLDVSGEGNGNVPVLRHAVDGVLSCRLERHGREGGIMKLSARNRLKGTVKSIRRGEAIANVELDVGGQRVVASITVEAVDELGLREGSDVTAVIKASDVMIATE
jgi:molybdopterin-binding protein